MEWGDLTAPLPIRCEVRYFDLTAHATREDLVSWICEDVKPSRVMLVHGDPDAQEWFSTTLAQTRPGMEIVQPPPGQPIPLFPQPA